MILLTEFRLPLNTMRKLLIFSFTSFVCPAMAQQLDTTFLKQLLLSKPELFGKILEHPTYNEVQILYTQVNRGVNNLPTFKTYGYNVNAERYFYPASTVKLAAVIFALEKINERKLPQSVKVAAMHIDSSFYGLTKVMIDTSTENAQPSINHCIKKILLTSDNDAFNRLYEFIGRGEINEKLKKYGLTNSRIINRLAIGDAGESAKNTNPIDFFVSGKLVYHQNAQYDRLEYPLSLTNLLVGKGYIDGNNKLVNRPYSFENKNVFTIADQHALMQRLMMPEAFSQKNRFKLTAEDYQHIYTYMSKLPTESDYPKHEAEKFWPTYGKMLYYGRDNPAALNPSIKIFNKYGNSYGFIIDNAYFVDFEKKVEFFLTAVVQSNEDGIYNDNKYEYETVCYPFMKNLGRVIYDFEVNRQKGLIPKLKKYKMKF